MRISVRMKTIPYIKQTNEEPTFAFVANLIKALFADEPQITLCWGDLPENSIR